MRFKLVLLIWCVLYACKTSKPLELTKTEQMTYKNLDWQGHRGARGLLPENTIPAFLKALEYEVTTLEMDLAVSKDEVLIVSHEPWMSEHICSHPQGKPVEKAEAKNLLIYEMTYEQIRQYDCGSRGNRRFPGQIPMKAYKPSLNELVKTVEAHCEKTERKRPYYNIELKSRPAWDNKLTPAPESFVALVLAAVQELGIKQRSTLQSFDERVIREIHRQDPSVTVALLIENMKSPQVNLASLGFKPHIYSPYFKLVKPATVRYLHGQGIKVIPWTVNEVQDMKKMIALGVDGIITDYPDRIGEALASDGESDLKR